MRFRRRKKPVSLHEHLRNIEEAQQKVFDLQRKLRDEAVTVETLDALGDAYAAYLRIATENVALHKGES